MSTEPPAKLHVPAHERAIRAEAGNPQNSVFLSANAGSGKTTILTGRVIRLLLDGVDPSGILCLTYTKAAAAEMQDRIFKELAAWVSLPDARLAEKIANLTGAAPQQAQILAARRLFARAIETPGGLKLQTIHAFAERLLHLFPFEANVPFRFTVIDEQARAELIRQAKHGTIVEALAKPEGPLGRAFDAVALSASDSGLDSLLDEAMPLFSGHGLDAVTEADRDRALRTALGLTPDETAETLAAEVCSGALPAEAWAGAAAAIATGSATDQSLAETIRNALTLDGVQRARTYLEVFLTKDGSPRKRLLTAPTAKRLPDIAAALAADAARAPGSLERFRAFDALERSGQLWTLAETVQERFVAAKQTRGMADFDDLIQRTLQLVADPGAAWVLCKLDSGITHVLVDEAQDTNPAMWDIVRELTAEFFAGAGAVRRARTIFAVGDEKQSIFSFQGAAPKAFAAARALYRQRAGDAGAPFVGRELKLSFRTVPDILTAVDAVFADPARRRGLSSEDIGTAHESARAGAAGFVEIWPLIVQQKDEARDPTEEVDAPGRHSADVLAARRLARHVGHLVRSGRYEDDGTRVRAGDIMVLVQRRDAFFDAVIRALKREQVPVAGADRIKLTEQIAVLDLLASARAALLPEDDLSIAEVLKGPLIGLDDADLLRLAPERVGALYAALAASPEAQHQAAHARIEGWRALARARGPFGFFQRILGKEGGRKQLLSRLGLDAAEAIDVFLTQAQAFEQREPPTLAGFLSAFAAFDGDVKRDQEQAGDAVRVLTVHGAKGLEARVVYLADAARLPVANKDPRVITFDGALIWPPAKKACPAAILNARATAQTARMEEYRRLLYVAMTRARDRLYVSGWTKEGGPAPDCWYAMIDAALQEHRREATNETGETVARWRLGNDIAPPAADAPAPQRPATALPEWIATPAAAPVPQRRVSPSRALDVPEIADAGRAGPRLRGGLVHLLLEVLPDLPQAEQEAQALRLIAARAPGLPAAAQRRIVSEALGMMRAPEAAAVFGTGSRAEAPIAGQVVLPSGETVAVSGRIDRLLVAADHIVVADFKSGRPQDGAAHAAQLALYRALLARLYPGRPIDCLILWSRQARVERLDAATLDSAFAALATP